MSIKPFLVLCSLLLLTACSEPLPQDKLDYAGHWQGQGMELTIEADGAVSYQRREGAKSTTINAPLKHFKGDDFIVGIGPFDTTFVVSQPPQMTAEGWRMTVDGVELYK
jgi:hypothetical protein